MQKEADGEFSFPHCGQKLPFGIVFLLGILGILGITDLTAFLVIKTMPKRSKSPVNANAMRVIIFAVFGEINVSLVVIVHLGYDALSVSFLRLEPSASIIQILFVLLPTSFTSKRPISIFFAIQVP